MERPKDAERGEGRHGTGGSNPSLSVIPWPARMERCESGRIGAPGERVGAKSVPWVRIPPSPLKQVVLRVLASWTKGGGARGGGSGALYPASRYSGTEFPWLRPH